MRFLLDVCAGGRLKTRLIEQGHDVLEVREIDQAMTDAEVLEIASNENRIVKAKEEAITKPPNNEEEYGKETSKFIKSLSGLTPDQRIMAIANKLLEETISLHKILLRIEKDMRKCKISR